MSRRRILYVMPNVGQSGGTEQQLLLLIQQLSTTWDITVAYLYPLSTFADAYRKAGARLIHLGMRHWWDPRGLWRLWRLLKAGTFDLVHASLFDAVVSACPLARWAGVPVVVSSRRNLDDWMKPWHVALIRFANRHTDAVIVNAQALKQFVVRREGLPEDRVHIIYNALDPTVGRIDPEAVAGVRKELNLQPDERLICAIGNMKPAKGYPDLIDAARLVTLRVPSARFVIVGDGAMRDSLRKQADALGLNGTLRFMGRRADARAFLAASDVCAFASLREGQSNVMLEAMALGVPVVATSVGGTPETIQNRKTGRLVPPGNSVALAQAIAEVVVKRDQAMAMAEQAKLTVAQRFPLAVMVSAYEQLYRQLMEQCG